MEGGFERKLGDGEGGHSIDMNIARRGWSVWP